MFLFVIASRTVRAPNARGPIITEPTSRRYAGRSPAWGAIALGAMAALGLGLAVFIALGIAGALDTRFGETLLVFVQYLDLFVAGYLAARFSRRDEALNGGLAGLVVSAFAAVISMVGGADLGLVLTVVLGVVGVIIGTAGGVLAAGVRR